IGRVGVPFMTMDYPAGAPLESIIDEGPLAPGRAVAIMSRALDVVAAAHRAGVVHRDLKPANLLVEPLPEGGETVRVLDFGVAQILGDDGKPRDSSVTTSGSVVG